MTHDGVNNLHNATEIDEDIKPNFLINKHYQASSPSSVMATTMSALTTTLPNPTVAVAAAVAAAAHNHHHHHHNNLSTAAAAAAAFHGYHHHHHHTSGNSPSNHHSTNNSHHHHHYHPGHHNTTGHKSSPFLFPAEIYKSLFASAVLQQQQQHIHHQQQQHSPPISGDNINNYMNNISSSVSNANDLINSNRNCDSKTLINDRKIEIESMSNENHRIQSPTITNYHQQQPFPRNLLFSCTDKTDHNISENSSDIVESKVEKPSFAWTSDAIITSSSNLANNNNNTSSNNRNNTNNNNNNNTSNNSNNNNQPISPLGNNSDTILRTASLRNPSNSINTTAITNTNNNNTRQQSGEETPVSGSIESPITQSTAISPSPVIAPSTATAMPVHQGQNPTQGLVHWMSAVMAEHIQGNTHHDPTVGMHYMWNGGVDQCGQHSKDIDYSGWPPAPRNHMTMKQGYEAKMNDHHNLQKGHILDDGRLDHHSAVAQAAGHQMAIYGATPAGLRPASSSSSSPGGGGGGGPGVPVGVPVVSGPNPNSIGHHGHHSSSAAAALLVVPQPINATKITAGLANGSGTGRKYQCKMCPQIFSSKADLQLHTQIHMREAKPYKCSQCSKAFANSSYLSQHTRIHLGIKPYRCEICQRKFTQLSHLQQHIRTHTGDKPYKCRHPGCQKAFSQLSNLQSHSRCHQTDKPYKCNSCYKCFTDEPSLLEHIPKHKESKHLKTHICQYCGKSYTQETYLTKHMQKHSERTDKRPPIVTGSGGNSTTANNNSSGGGGGSNGNTTTSNSGVNNSAGNASNNTTATNNSNNNPNGVAQEHSYWPKVSPDSQANINDVMHQQQQQQQQQHVQQQNHHDFPPLNSQHQQNATLQSHHNPGDHSTVNPGPGPVRDEVGPTPTGYDTSSITKTSSNSAFTPITNSTMVSPHLAHHPMAQRPYLYDAISFQNKNVNQNTANTFPNQLISLHQIRNYAHQPAGLMAGEHLLGVSVGAGK